MVLFNENASKHNTGRKIVGLNFHSTLCPLSVWKDLLQCATFPGESCPDMLRAIKSEHIISIVC